MVHTKSLMLSSDYGLMPCGDSVLQRQTLIQVPEWSWHTRHGSIWSIHFKDFQFHVCVSWLTTYTDYEEWRPSGTEVGFEKNALLMWTIEVGDFVLLFFLQGQMTSDISSYRERWKFIGQDIKGYMVSLFEWCLYVDKYFPCFFEINIHWLL